MTEHRDRSLSEQQRHLVDEITGGAMEARPADLAGFVRAQACGDDAVAQEALSLVRRAWDEEETAAVEASRAMIEGCSAADDSPRIPGYKILHQLGRGGMGSVYAAVKIDAAARPIVAIKVVRRGVDTEDVLRRFETERQVLGALDHPNIARLYDAGETDAGVPFFVMELIEGLPIDRYCDSNGLSIRARLELFRKVCSAVHHAHTNLIVHRDLKPSNIIVTAAGEPKLLDFGIAKLLNPQLVHAVAITGPGVRIMTPEYASPEQVRGEPVTTKSDVYSLGVLLYELLSGHRPYQILSRVEEEIRRIVCEIDPERPSTAVLRVEEQRRSDGTTETITPQTVAKRRDERFPTLRRQLAGDLDDIVMSAMAKAPGRRYESADALADDIYNYIEGNPVAAHRTGSRALYEIRKLARRHRTAVAASAAAGLTLLAGGAVTALQWREASIANARAAVAAQEEVTAQREAAQSEQRKREAEKNQLIAARFTSTLWDQAQRHISFSMRPSDRAAFWNDVQEDFDDLSKEFGADNPVVRRERARASVQVGNTLGGIREGNLGDEHGALRAYQRARDEFLQILHDDPNNIALRFETAEATKRVADTLRTLNRPSEAKQEYDRAVALVEAIDHPPDDHATARRFSQLRFSIAQTAALMGDADRAMAAFTREVQRRRMLLSRFPKSLNAHRDLAVALLNTAELKIEMGDPDTAAEMLEESLDLRRTALTSRPTHPTLRRDVAVGLIALGEVRADQGRFKEAASAFDESDEILQTLAAERAEDARIPMTAAEGAHESVDAAIRQINFTLAHARLKQANEWIERLTRVAPDHPRLARLRARQRLLTGWTQLGEGDADAAAENFRIARDQFDALGSIDETSVEPKHLLADALFGLGESQRKRADQSADAGLRRSAHDAITRSLHIYESLGGAGAVFGASNERWRAIEEALAEVAAAPDEQR